MVNEEKNFQRFREMIIAQQKNGQTGFLIWKSPEEREAMGGDEKEMKVNGAFLPHGIRSDGRFYGEYRESMELDRAIRGAVLIKGQFNLSKKDGIIAMLFIVENLLANNQRLKNVKSRETALTEAVSLFIYFLEEGLLFPPNFLPLKHVEH